MANARWHYSGDVNPEHGGFWYRLDNWHYGYADFVRITPCSDAGGPDNRFWIESGSINGTDDEKRIAESFNSCGWMSDEFKGAARKHAIVQALLGYGHYDIEKTETVQIGQFADIVKHREMGSQIPDKILRANTLIENYVRRQYLRNV